MVQTILEIFMRYLHTVSAMLAVGGLAFSMVCVSPAIRMLDDGFRDTVLKLVQRRFERLLWLAIAGLVVSGVYNWIITAGLYKEMGPSANALIGTKVLLALVMFGNVWLASLGKVRPRAAQMVNIHLAAAVILLAVILRHMRLEHLAAIVPTP